MLSPLVSGFWKAIVCSCSQIKNGLQNNLPQPLLRWIFFFLPGMACPISSTCVWWGVHATDRTQSRWSCSSVSLIFKPEQQKWIIRVMLICQLSEWCSDRCYYPTGTFPCLYALDLFYVSRHSTRITFQTIWVGSFGTSLHVRCAVVAQMLISINILK